jgi:hypothetical protein
MTQIKVKNLNQASDTMREEYNFIELTPVEVDWQGKPYYNGTACMEAIEAMGHGKGFCIGNIVKALWRLDGKDTPQENLEKAQWYLNRLGSYYDEQE